jgi:hypothetical protein
VEIAVEIIANTKVTTDVPICYFAQLALDVTANSKRLHDLAVLPSLGESITVPWRSKIVPLSISTMLPQI